LNEAAGVAVAAGDRCAATRLLAAERSGAKMSAARADLELPLRPVPRALKAHINIDLDIPERA
jgi:hypothetical protein